MNPLSRAWPAVVAACLLGFAAGARAADEKPIDSKALDRYLYTSLRFVINHGVDLYNRPDDPRGAEKCYQHFRQSLEELVPVLSNHPDLQKAIKDGLDKAEKDPEWRVKMAARGMMPNPQAVPPGDVVRVKAFALRAVFNDVRSGLNPEPPKAAGLWDRLGGEKGVRKILDDFAELVGADPKVDITRGGKRKLDELTVADLKQKSLELISEKAGGPLKYTGRGLKPVHQGMGITDAEFDAAAADFKKALLKNQINPADADALMRIVEATRKDIVEGKGAGAPKGDGGTVKGRVTVGGKPLAKGKITLTGEGGKAISDAIEADGSYTLENVPPGTYKVTVTGAKEVPAAFGDPNTTPTTANVNKGMNLLDLDLPGGTKPEGKLEGRRPRVVPDTIAVPAGFKAGMELAAEGVQIYQAKGKAAGGFEWALKAPRADLSADGTKVGKHYGSPAGPVWEITPAGMTITGKVQEKADAPAGNIPWLLLEVQEVRVKEGILKKDQGGPLPIAYVQRLDTEGGAAPARAPETGGDTAEVSYKATYVFYAPDKKSEEKGAEDAGTVSGKVTYKGVPVPAGTIAFHPKEGKAISAKLSEDGSYSADMVPPGEYAVTVETDSVKPPAKFVKLPKKYAGPETSGLKYTVVKGKQAFDIALED
jgi:hemoglobin